MSDPGRREVISARNVWAGYGNDPVLEDVSFSAYEGDFIGLIGPNGGGKTTLLRVLLGLLPPQRGEVLVAGKPPEEGRQAIGYVPQAIEFDRDVPISVRDVARMGRLGKRRLLQPYTAADDAIVAEALRQVELYDMRDRPIGDLSIGQRQRAYIARALATRPEILLLDEPTSSVDPQASVGVYDLLRQLNDDGVTVLLVTHDIGVISSHVKTVGCLNRQLHYHGTRDLSADMLEQAYPCPVELLAHGVPHRVFPTHQDNGQEEEG
jgi:zinc transport system ATP-binding protein